MFALLAFACLMVIDIVASFWKGLIAMIIFNWFAPIIHPPLIATYMQALAAILLLGAYRAMTNKSKGPQTKDEIIEAIVAQFVHPMVVLVVFGILYAGCVVPFK